MQKKPMICILSGVLRCALRETVRKREERVFATERRETVRNRRERQCEKAYV